MQHLHSPIAVIDADNSPHIAVRFPLQGRQLPADHGYALYSAITRKLPALHDARWLGLELISGVPWQEGIIALPTRGAHLNLRLPADHFAQVLPLAGCRLEIDKYSIRLGIPSARPLLPASSVYARCVTIKGFIEAEPFLDAARRQLDALGLVATLELPLDEEGRFRRRILTIKDKAIIGFSVAAHHLSDEDSIKLQSTGIGGRRSMGCGIFNPIISSLSQRITTNESI